MPESRLERTRQAYREPAVGTINRATESFMYPRTPETEGMTFDEARAYAKAHAASGTTSYSGPRWLIEPQPNGAR